LSKFKLLIAIPSPRDIPEFERAVEDIPHDKIWIKYVTYDDIPNPYQRFVNYFKRHKEYSHLAILPDDLIPTPDVIERLVNHAKDGLRCVTGYSNMDMNDMDRYPICYNDVTPQRQGRDYQFLTKETLPDDLFQARWQGTSFMILDRDLVNRLEWIGDMVDGANPGMGIQAFDVGICYQLNKMNIPIWVDPKCWMLHMRYGGEKKTGLEPKDVWIDKVGVPRDRNKAVHIEKLKMAWDDFKGNNMTNNSFLNKIIEELVAAAQSSAGKTLTSKAFRDTLN